MSWGVNFQTGSICHSSLAVKPSAEGLVKELMAALRRYQSLIRSAIKVWEEAIARSA